MDDQLHARLAAALADNSAQLESLQRQHDEIVGASRDSNADDEHDPEGATIAFERQQVVALRDQLLRTRADLEHALATAGTDDYGRCESCGGPIGTERLLARPTARRCIRCAARR